MSAPAAFARAEAQVALITGAASGIGAATVHRLAADGVATFVLIDRDAAGLHDIVSWLRSRDARVLAFAHDVGDAQAWTETARAIEQAYDGLTLVVANAGIASGASIADTTVDEWQAAMSANLDGTFFTLQHGMRLIRRGGTGGAVVVVASVSAVKPEPGTAAYGASKAGALHLAKIAAKEGIADRIRVNAVLPGGVKTPIWRKLPAFRDLIEETGGEDQAFEAMAKQATPLGRFATAEEVAGHIVFLLSDAAVGMIGGAVTVDGGYSL